MNWWILRRTVTTLALCMLILCSVGYAAENIDPDDDGSQYAWGENVGWINFEPSEGSGVEVSNSDLTGYAWGENIGWINLSPTNGGVFNDGNGNLSGYAWGENFGWINFAPTAEGVTIDPNTGVFSGYAWGENIGWINFGLTNGGVKTSWRGADNDGDGFNPPFDCDDDDPNVHPEAIETCDDVDNDCDGDVDEGFDVGAICTVGVGACENTGSKICTADGLSTECNATPGNPTAEICNNIDDDCDNAIDEDLTQQCGFSDVGECQFGTQTCSSGNWSECIGNIDPTPEICDGLDNNCNGEVDEEDSDGDLVPDCVDSCPDEDATGLDANNDGCIDNIGGLNQLIQTLVAEGVSIDQQLQNSLLSKVENAQKSADKENICAAVNQLQAFKNEVNAQRDKKISNDAADLVITYVNNVIAGLLDQLPPGESC